MGVDQRGTKLFAKFRVKLTIAGAAARPGYGSSLRGAHVPSGTASLFDMVFSLIQPGAVLGQKIGKHRHGHADPR
jgi:hypothetical protein